MDCRVCVTNFYFCIFHISLWLKNAHRGLPCNLYGCDCIEQTNLLKSHLGEEETPKKIIKFLIILINCSSARQGRVTRWCSDIGHTILDSESLPFDDFVQNSNQIIKQSIFIKHRSNRKLLSCQTEFLSHDSWCLLLQEQ